MNDMLHPAGPRTGYELANAVLAVWTNVEVDDWELAQAASALDDLITPQTHAAEAALRNLLTEVDCRIEHGAESGGHLEYVRTYLQQALAELGAAAELVDEPSFAPCPACGVSLVDPTQKGADGLSICDDCRDA